jgi:hypothetical protein
MYTLKYKIAAELNALEALIVSVHHRDVPEWISRGFHFDSPIICLNVFFQCGLITSKLGQIHMSIDTESFVAGVQIGNLGCSLGGASEAGQTDFLDQSN